MKGLVCIANNFILLNSTIFIIVGINPTVFTEHRLQTVPIAYKTVRIIDSAPFAVFLDCKPFFRKISHEYLSTASVTHDFIVFRDTEPIFPAYSVRFTPWYKHALFSLFPAPWAQPYTSSFER